MESVTLDQALDIIRATLWDFKKELPAMTYLYSSYAMINKVWESRMKISGGKEVRRYITLGDEDNARHRGNWEEDTHNVANIDKTILASWVTASSNLSWNRIEASMNSGAAEIYDVIENKYRNCLREICDEVYQGLLSVPYDASDNLKPVGLPGWFPLGTDDSTGGWTGYTGTYADGSTSFNVGGIPCTSSVNSRWASYYADHNGNIDLSLLVLLDRATRKLHFEAPMVPKKQNDPSARDKFALYSNDNVIGTLNLLYAQGDDQMGRYIDKHFGVPTFKGIPFHYVDILDTAATSLYGTDPIFGVNHELFYPVVLQDWDFHMDDPRKRDNQLLVITVDTDLVYTYICENRKYAGFLVSQQ